ncbi:MAG: hypothetical protein J7K23_06255 [Thermoproteales archaeon]|nr:hypothetical protein [Thermoproteales archaeon]
MSPGYNVKARYVKLLISMIVGTLGLMFSKGIINFIHSKKVFHQSSQNRSHQALGL